MAATKAAATRYYSAEEITAGLLALCAWAGQATAASRYLKAEKKLEITPSTLSHWKVRHSDEYNALREKYSARLEEQLAHEMREAAMFANKVERLALERA